MANLLIYIDRKWEYTVLDSIKYLDKKYNVSLYVETIKFKKFIINNYSIYIKNIFCIEEELSILKNKKNTFNNQKLKKLQLKLGSSISKIYVSDFLNSEIFSIGIKNIKEYNQKTFINYLIIEKILKKTKPDFIFLENTSGYFSKLLSILAKNNNIKIQILVFYELYFKDKFIFVDENERSLYLENYYKRKNYNYKVAKTFIENFKNSKDIFSPVETLAKINTKNNFLHIIKDIYKIKNFNLLKFKNYIKRIYLNKKLIKYKDLDAKKYGKYVVYFLSYQPEASSYGNSFYNYNQIEIIKYISMFLPSDIKLIVKEHKANTVDSLNNINKILLLKKNYPNIYIANFKIPSKDLIKKSLCTITLSGTVGIESIFLKKPVITIGNIFYNFYKNVSKINSFQELEKSIFSLYKKNFKFVGSNLKITNSILDSFFDGDIMTKTININNSKKISKSINKIVIFFKN